MEVGREGKRIPCAEVVRSRRSSPSTHLPNPCRAPASNRC